MIGISSNIYSQENETIDPNNIEINFNELDIKSMIELIGKVTNKSFLYENNINQSKKITLLSTGYYTIDDAYKIFENILDINGYTTINEGPYIRIINKNEARSIQSQVVKGVEGNITDGDYVTSIIDIENTTVNNIRASITPFLSPTTLVNQYNPTNSLILKDSRSVIEKVVKLISVIDSKDGKIELGYYPIINANINRVLAILNDLLIKEAKQKIYFHIDINNYALIVLASKKNQDIIEEILSKLDNIVDIGTVRQFYDLKFATTKEIVALTNLIFPPGAAGAVGNSPIKIIEDTRNNRLLIIGPEQSVKQAINFIKSADVPISSNASLYKVFKLNNTNSVDLSKTLQLVTRSVSEIANQTPTKQPTTTAVTKSDISIVNDEQTNSIVVFASQGEMALIDLLINELDRPQPQVFLEVMILEVNLDKSLNLGIDWKAAADTGEALIGAGLGGAVNFFPSTTSTIIEEGISSQFGIIGPSLTYQGESYSSYSAFIQATKGDADFNLISNPQILTVSNQEAVIKVGEVRPFQTAVRIDANNNITNSYEYKEVGVSLKFTARIGQDNSILLKVDQSTKNVKETAGVTNNLTPTTFERNITTNILAKNNEIVVLGGLISENTTETVNKTYCLGDIPILGLAFRNKSSQSVKTNLLVYIKPTIVRNVNERFDLLTTANQNFQDISDGEEVENIVKEKFKPIRIEINDIEEYPLFFEDNTTEEINENIDE